MASNSAILEKQVADLRTELKAWEQAFAAKNGRKAGRDDIDNDASVTGKYREYHRLRRPLGKPSAAKAETPRKPRHLRQPGSNRQRGTLQERAGNGNEGVVTPRKVWKNTASLEAVQEEEQEVEPTPAFIRCALGPTPQKDGQVLGIFDFATAATPSKSVAGGTEAVVPTINDTPNKPIVPLSVSKRALSATPQSSSKRRLLDAFIGTPLKRQKLDDGQTPSTAKRHYATPSFLRRSFPLAPVDEDTVAIAPLPKKRGLVRSLSSLIQGLRKQEDKRMDDDWDIMNELESGIIHDKPQPEVWQIQVEESQASAKQVQVEDSQAPDMPLGPDQGPTGSDSEDGEDGQVALGRDGKPRKPWKKKGLKRQTKRTNMRPVLHKPKKAGELEEQAEKDSEDEVEAVGETQLADGGDEDAEKDGDEAQTKRKKAKLAAGADASPSSKKASKKVSAQANANFRRLKIKNKNSEANGRGGGKKFGRR